MRNPRHGRDHMLVAAGAALVGLATGIAAAASRRAAVEAADSMTGDWLDGLTADHLEIIERFDLIEASDPVTLARRRKLAQRLRMFIEKHAFQEETVVYPAARLLGAEAEVAKLVANQAEIKLMLYQLDRIADVQEWSDLVEQLRRVVERHIAEEEAGIFQLLREKLDPREEAELTALVYKTGAKLA
jgi:hemerythrin superfamily protein